MDDLTLPVVYQRGHAVVLDAYGLPCTAADLRRVLTGLEAQQAAAPDELRPFFAAPIAWRRRLLAALETVETAHAAA